MTRLLFYLLLILLPTQLGRHFFFDFSSVLGIRNDYLAPTIFLTDVVIILMVGWEFISIIKYYVLSIRKKQKLKLVSGRWFLVSGFCFLLFVNLFIAANKWAAFYKLIKIVEFILLGAIIIKLKPKLNTVLSVLSVGVVYSALIALGQFIIQRSIGGVFWWLGERTFFAGTPGIAAFSWGGQLVLRPYATFPHPNVLGGFLAVVLPLLLLTFQNNRISIIRVWLFMSLVLGLIVLFLSFSRAAWIVAIFGFVLVISGGYNVIKNSIKEKKGLFLGLFYGFLIISAFVPFLAPKVLQNTSLSWQERRELINAAMLIIKEAPLFGVGLNNFIVHLDRFVESMPSLYVFQPVHNIYLLALAETGLIGFFLFLSLIITSIFRSLAKPIIFLPLIQLYLLGVFDHYLITLQQGQLLFTIFISLAVSGVEGVAFLSENS